MSGPNRHLFYMPLAGRAVGALAYTQFADNLEQLALILTELGQGEAATYLAASAVVALPSVILAFYGQSRIYL